MCLFFHDEFKNTHIHTQYDFQYSVYSLPYCFTRNHTWTHGTRQTESLLCFVLCLQYFQTFIFSFNKACLYKRLKNIVDLGTIRGFKTPTSLLQSKSICDLLQLTLERHRCELCESPYRNLLYKGQL